MPAPAALTIVDHVVIGIARAGCDQSVEAVADATVHRLRVHRS
ncbi:hypothetical protein [Agromyces badenianii]|nr:hypothetical protein [Agromyces badenianii]